MNDWIGRGNAQINTRNMINKETTTWGRSPPTPDGGLRKAFKQRNETSANREHKCVVLLEKYFTSCCRHLRNTMSIMSKDGNSCNITL